MDNIRNSLDIALTEARNSGSKKATVAVWCCNILITGFLEGCKIIAEAIRPEPEPPKPKLGPDYSDRCFNFGASYSKKANFFKWFVTPNKKLKSITPKQAIENGDLTQVETLAAEELHD